MKLKIEVIDILQMFLDKINDDDLYGLGYARCIEDLARLIGEDPDLYGIKKS